LSLIDRIKLWRLRRRIPENLKGSHRWRYKGDGKTKVFLDDNFEAERYRYARKRQKEKEDRERL